MHVNILRVIVAYTHDAGASLASDGLTSTVMHDRRGMVSLTATCLKVSLRRFFADADIKSVLYFTTVILTCFSHFGKMDLLKFETLD